MSFETLLGNEQLKKELSESVARGQFSHCYLISGPRGSGKKTLARLLAAAILCRGSGKPCLRCHPCRKVMEGSHPDFITWEAQELGLEGQNALLTILEEPPRYAVFLLLADNPDQLLPTVRSRCRELKLTALSRELLERELSSAFPKASPEDIRAAILRSGGFLGQAKQLLEDGAALPPQTEQLFAALSRRDGLALTRVLTPMEKWKRDQLIPMLEGWLSIAVEALTVRSGGTAMSSQARMLAGSRSSPEIHRMILALQKALQYAKGNVSPGAICGWLTWALRE